MGAFTPHPYKGWLEQDDSTVLLKLVYINWQINMSTQKDSGSQFTDLNSKVCLVSELVK